MLGETKTPKITIMCGNTVLSVQLQKPRTAPDTAYHAVFYCFFSLI